jgi:hypothetical protein
MHVNVKDEKETEENNSAGRGRRIWDDIDGILARAEKLDRLVYSEMITKRSPL